MSEQILNTIRPELLKLGALEISALFPYFALVLGTLVALMVSVLKSFNPKWPVYIITLVTALFTLFYAGDWWISGEGKVQIFNNMMVVDKFSSFFTMVIMGAVAVTAMISFRYLDDEKLQYPEYNLLLLFAAFGMIMLVSSLDLIVLFISLEIMSLAVYTLVGFRRADRRSNEAAMKYFILGSAASAILLYGAALLYGATGSTNITVMSKFVVSQAGAASPLFVLGMWLVVVGFLFKVAVAPFHMWMPDVYEGAPTPITGFMTTGLKAAAFASFLRFFFSLGFDHALAQGVHNHLHAVLWVCAVLTMILGNIIALAQTNVKRMLAYSSIAHTGYILVGFLTGKSENGYTAILVYLVGYVLANLGAFAVLTLLAARSDTGLNLHDLSGLSRRRPGLALALSIFLLSMAGIPPTAGFFAKYLLFYSAVQAGEVGIVIIGVLCSAVSVYFYLRVLVFMYMREPVSSPSGRPLPAWPAMAAIALAFLTLQVGIFPNALKVAAETAIKSVQ